MLIEGKIINKAIQIQDGPATTVLLLYLYLSCVVAKNTTQNLLRDGVAIKIAVDERGML